MLDQGLAVGVERNADSPIDAMSALRDDMIDEAESVGGLTIDRRLQTTFAPSVAVPDQGTGLLSRLDKILNALERGQVLTIDGDEFVGATASKYDRQLGERHVLAARGAI